MTIRPSKGGRLPRSNGFVRLRALKCFPEVHLKLKEGWPLPHVVRFIQDEQHEYDDVSKEGLVSILHKYKQTIPPMELVKDSMPTSIANKVEEMSSKFNELEGLHELWLIQKARIAMDHKHENTIKKSINTVGNDIRIAREIAQASADLKLEIGLIQRATPEPVQNQGMDINLKVEHIDSAPASVQKILENPQSRHKLLAIAKSLLLSSAAEPNGLASETIIDMPPEQEEE